MRAKRLFDLGRLLITPGALVALNEARQTPYGFLYRHATGDWGDDLSPRDRRQNNFSVKNGLRILSSYLTRNETKIWIITEATRESTTILLPEEY